MITGAARGQGAAEARRFLEEGAHVVINDILDEEGARLAADLGDRAIFVRHDVAKEDSWRALFEEVEQKFGRCDVLVNNAAVFRLASIADTSVEMMETFFRVNHLGTLLGMKYAAPLMKKNGGGVIINISSIGGLRGFPRAVAYGSTKWAVRGMTKVAAMELASDGIRVNSVHPGFITTDMHKELTEEELRIGAEMTPLKRHGQPSEVAALVSFLASDEAGFITGAEIAVDGGWTL
ncbi:glucose 1-dehydrogenase [Bradyrhizobium jicamae]|uniref:Glucose 1-dehydrogenase n=1 Tax=Bradyrhizobium jicamae TaxID=280332 RepID=A0ABS5FDP8_9BRAD|nr:glucose 1-dehydrogenase [Bradyrhizobium jicamae]